jgi:peptide-methionine (R)-S-oxide reductase
MQGQGGGGGVRMPIQIDEEELKKRVGEEAYNVLRKHGTERAFTSPLYKNKEPGTYSCAACQQPLFSSEHKFESGTGWPSFFQQVAKEAVKEVRDSSYGTVRTEVRCASCDSHLGHVFDDGYGTPTGLRYCINGCCLQFSEK